MEKKIIFVTELELFSIGIISLFGIIQLMQTTNVEIMDRDVKTII
jgi:hypothetical protein